MVSPLAQDGQGCGVDLHQGYAALRMPGHGVILSSETDNGTRALRRKLWSKAMGMAALRDFTPVIGARIRQCFDILQLQAESGAEFDIAALFSCMACVSRCSVVVPSTDFPCSFDISGDLGVCQNREIIFQGAS